jgi:hypothetical protein
MLPRLTAVQFERFMTSGRSSPSLCGCEDETGTLVGEYVVKLLGAVGVPGLLNELFAARLACHFGLESPEPALIMIDPTFVELIASTQPSQAARIRGSVGLNFGTKALSGVSTWPVDKSIPEAMLETAIDIFAFDALIQNADRRFDNPNLFTRGDSLLVFDHETAFSFLLALFPSPTSWKLGDQQYLTHHVFYRKLKSKAINLSRFTASLSGLSDALLADIVAEVPAEWNNENQRSNSISGRCGTAPGSLPMKSRGSLYESRI